MVLSLLLVCVPMSLVLAYVVAAPQLWVFITAALAIVPLANGVRRATEELAKHTGPTVGGLLNVTFGNVPELVLSLFVLAAEHPDVVKGQITGAIIGNGLLGLGLAILAGTWGRECQKFNVEQAGFLSSLLILSTVALLVPAMFEYTERDLFAHPGTDAIREHLSLGVALVLILVYAFNLVYTLMTHRDTFAPASQAAVAEWATATALTVLVGTTVLTAVEAELVSGALEATAEGLHLSPFFLGVIVLAVVGNAAEYVSAVYFARHGDLGLALAVTVGSTIQIALLVAPVLVLLSYLIGHPMDLVFANPLELVAIVAVTVVVNAIAHDGRATWFEGVMLLSIYAILGLAFFFISP